MKKTIALWTVFLFVCMSFTSISGNQINENIVIPSLKGNTLYVGGNGTDNYTTIQGAINNSFDNDTVYVYNGTYIENVIVNKPINLIGEDKNITIIDGGKKNHVIGIYEDKVSISDFTIKNSSKYDGTKVYAGLAIYSKNNIIKQNIIKNNNEGIILYSNSVFNNISENLFFSNSDIDLYIRYSKGNNVFLKNKFTGGCIQLYSSSNNTFMENVIGPGGGGMHLHYSNENVISKNEIFSSNNQGIWLDKSNHNEIFNNNIHSNTKGIGIYKSINNRIYENNFSDNEGSIWITESSNRNKIYNNNISNNKGGILIDYFSCNNYIFDNIISQNVTSCLKIRWGSHNNTIYHNNFIDSPQYVNDECNNFWDDGKYGNYWSDYKDRYPDAKPKLFKPWMWDTPYEILGGDNKDNCPLVNQWPNSVSLDISRDRTTNNIVLWRLFERFPLLQQLIDVWRSNI